MRYARIIPVLCVLLLMACGQNSEAGPSQQSSNTAAQASAQPLTNATSQSTQAAQTAAPSAQPDTSGAQTYSPILITYQHYSAKDATNDSMTILTDGTIELRNKNGALKPAKVDPSQFAQLQQLITSPAFTGLDQLPPTQSSAQAWQTFTVPGTDG